MQQTVLVIEDEPAVREVLRFHLEHTGYKVRACETAAHGWLGLSGADAVVLDWMLPDEAGISWLKRLRLSVFSEIPVLMLTARAAEKDRVDGLDAGADDYLTKPFSAAELAARVRALLRRAKRDDLETLRIGRLEVDFKAAEVRLEGRALALTRREFDLLAFLAKYPGGVYSRQALLDRVWGLDFVGGERTVDQHIAQLREHLQDDPNSPQFIETVRGKGYRMVEVGEQS
jgi:two-component system, OmpR family, response regulator RegX3